MAVNLKSTTWAHLIDRTYLYNLQYSSKHDVSASIYISSMPSSIMSHCKNASSIRRYLQLQRRQALHQPNCYTSTISNTQHNCIIHSNHNRLSYANTSYYRTFHSTRSVHAVNQFTFHHPFYAENYQYKHVNPQDDTALAETIPLMHDMNKVRGRDFKHIDIVVAERKPDCKLNEADRYTYDSYVCLRYNFANNEKLRQKYNLFNTNKMRIGRILEDADALSGDICYKHIGIRHDAQVTCVTATIDRVDLFRSLPAEQQNTLPADSLECDWVMSGKITWLGTTSMEVRIDIGRIINDEIQSLGNAFFVFVARDKTTYKKYTVPKLTLVSDIDEQLFNEGIEHNTKRRERIDKPHQVQLPNQDELLQLHKLYLETHQTTPGLFHGFQTKKMSSTKVGKVSLMHSQDRNIHNKMFGGHLLRLAFELSWACAYATTHILPKLQVVDDIHFYLPVEIGSLLSFDSEIWYINPDDSTVFVHVQAKVIDTSTGRTKHTTNEFYFQFVCESANNTNNKLPYIVPESYSQMLKYLEGRRRNKQFQQTSHHCIQP